MVAFDRLDDAWRKSNTAERLRTFQRLQTVPRNRRCFIGLRRQHPDAPLPQEFQRLISEGVEAVGWKRT